MVRLPFAPYSYSTLAWHSVPVMRRNVPFEALDDDLLDIHGGESPSDL